MFLLVIFNMPSYSYRLYFLFWNCLYIQFAHFSIWWCDFFLLLGYNFILFYQSWTFACYFIANIFLLCLCYLLQSNLYFYVLKSIIFAFIICITLFITKSYPKYSCVVYCDKLHFIFLMRFFIHLEFTFIFYKLNIKLYFLLNW